MTSDEAYEMWDVCYTQAKVARARLSHLAERVLEDLRRGFESTRVGRWALEDAFEAQDVLENAEAALSTAREVWDAADERLTASLAAPAPPTP